MEVNARIERSSAFSVCAIQPKNHVNVDNPNIQANSLSGHDMLVSQKESQRHEFDVYMYAYVLTTVGLAFRPYYISCVYRNI